ICQDTSAVWNAGRDARSIHAGIAISAIVSGSRREAAGPRLDEPGAPRSTSEAGQRLEASTNGTGELPQEPTHRRPCRSLVFERLPGPARQGSGKPSSRQLHSDQAVWRNQDPIAEPDRVPPEYAPVRQRSLRTRSHPGAIFDSQTGNDLLRYRREPGLLHAVREQVSG